MLQIHIMFSVSAIESFFIGMFNHRNGVVQVRSSTGIPHAHIDLSIGPQLQTSLHQYTGANAAHVFTKTVHFIFSVPDQYRITGFQVKLPHLMMIRSRLTT